MLSWLFLTYINSYGICSISVNSLQLNSHKYKKPGQDKHLYRIALRFPSGCPFIAKDWFFLDGQLGPSKTSAINYILLKYRRNWYFGPPLLDWATHLSGPCIAWKKRSKTIIIWRLLLYYIGVQTISLTMKQWHNGLWRCVWLILTSKHPFRYFSSNGHPTGSGMRRRWWLITRNKYNFSSWDIFLICKTILKTYAFL